MISVIIPALNEEKSIRSTIEYVFKQVTCKRLLKEVIVVDGGSIDRTVTEASMTRARIIRCRNKERVHLLNLGAKRASGKILYFLNAGSQPPKNFIGEIIKAQLKGFCFGTFSIEFDKKHWLLNFLSWSSRQKRPLVQLCDQSLFITKDLFEKSGGFREDHLVMSTQEMISRLKRYSDFIVFKDPVVTSAMKYTRSGIVKTGFIQGLVYILHNYGVAQFNLVNLYRKFLHWNIGSSSETVKTVSLKKNVSIAKHATITPVSLRN